MRRWIAGWLFWVAALAALAVPARGDWQLVGWTGQTKTGRETKAGLTVSVTLPPGWDHETYGPDWRFVLKEQRDAFGSVDCYRTSFGTARAEAEDARRAALDEEGYAPNENPGSSRDLVSQVEDMDWGGGWSAAVLFRYDDAIGGGRRTTVDYFVVRGGVGVIIEFECPNNLWKRPGLMDDVDFILSNMRF